MQDPVNNVDLIHYIDNWTFTALDQNVSHNDYTGRNEFQLANLDQNVAVINGTSLNTVETYYIDGDTIMSNWFSFNVVVENLNVPKITGYWFSGCPQSGSLDITLSNTWDWSNGTTFGSGGVNWTVTVTFNDGTATVTAGNGDETWRYECEVCNIPS